MEAAYPELPVEARERLENWRQEDNEDHLSSLDVLLEELHVLHRLLRIADEGRSGLWLAETLDQERQPLAAQAAYLLRNP